MLILYILIPFLFSALLGISTFLKNPKKIRLISKILFFIQFIIEIYIIYLKGVRIKLWKKIKRQIEGTQRIPSWVDSKTNVHRHPHA